MKKNLFFALGLVAVVAVFMLTGVSYAGTGGTEFDAANTTLFGWAEGGLGRGLSILGFIIGAAVLLARQTLTSVIVGIGLALSFAIVPGVIDSVVGAVF